MILTNGFDFLFVEPNAFGSVDTDMVSLFLGQDVSGQARHTARYRQK